MALTDTLKSTFEIITDATLTRTGGGGHTGTDKLAHNFSDELTDGSSANQASCWLSATFTATTGGITISLADSDDPLGAAGDDVPTADPEGLDVRLLVVENQDTTNYVSLSKGTNGVDWFGTTPSIKIPAGGIFVLYSPIDGLGAINDGSDDEIKVTANTASCSVKISVLYG